MRYALIVTAAGSSSRFNKSSDLKTCVKKEYLSIKGKSILARSIEPFLNIDGLCLVAITYRSGDLDIVKSLVSSLNIDSSITLLFVEGGSSRQESVFNALKALYQENNKNPIDTVFIHDGARAFVTTDLISRALDAALKSGGACPCLRVSDTLVKVDESGFFATYLSREGVCRVQTPQVFTFIDIYNAHKNANPNKNYTDDTEIFMDYGKKVCYVQGSEENKKITYFEDIMEN